MATRRTKSAPGLRSSPQGADHLPRSAAASASTGLRRIDLRGNIRFALQARTDPVSLRFPLPRRPRNAKRQSPGPPPACPSLDGPHLTPPYEPVCVPCQTSRVTILSCAENISSMVGVRSGKPASRSCIRPLGPATPTRTTLVLTSSLNRSSASAIFPAHPSVNHQRGHVHVAFTVGPVSHVFSGPVNVQRAPPLYVRPGCGSGRALGSPDCTADGGR